MPTSRKTPRTWTIGLAVSGGADSTALLAVLADLTLEGIREARGIVVAYPKYFR